jgi:hypothetical protein
LQCHKKIWRGIEDDGRVGARSGDAGKHGSLLDSSFYMSAYK